MPLVTECPKCRTLFKVVRDQLKISDGWVRCGHCGEIFDTAINLREWEAPSVQPIDLAAGSTGVDGTPHDTSVKSPDAFAPEAAAPAAIANDAKPDGAVVVPPLADPTVPQKSEVTTGVAPLPPDVVQQQTVATTPAPTQGSTDGGDASVSGESMPPADGYAQVSFMRKRHAQKSGAAKPRRRSIWAITALLLLWLLGLQWFWHERELFAAWSPGVRAMVGQLCDRIGCSVGPLHRIEFVAVESSSFNKSSAANRYLLNFSMRNQFNLEVARPSVELTLTDAADKPVYRKVLLAQDLTADAPVMPPGDEWAITVPVSVLPAVGPGGSKDKNQPAIVGYRLLAFYP